MGKKCSLSGKPFSHNHFALLPPSPPLATRLLAHKIQSPQEWEAIQALTVRGKISRLEGLGGGGAPQGCLGRKGLGLQCIPLWVGQSPDLLWAPSPDSEAGPKSFEVCGSLSVDISGHWVIALLGEGSCVSNGFPHDTDSDTHPPGCAGDS